MKTQNICPVMEQEIHDISTAPSSKYKGSTYYLCCENCKTSFDENPTNYVGNNGGHYDLGCHHC